MPRNYLQTTLQLQVIESLCTTSHVHRMQIPNSIDFEFLTRHSPIQAINDGVV